MVPRIGMPVQYEDRAFQVIDVVEDSVRLWSKEFGSRYVNRKNMRWLPELNHFVVETLN